MESRLVSKTIPPNRRDSASSPTNHTEKGETPDCGGDTISTNSPGITSILLKTLRNKGTDCKKGSRSPQPMLSLPTS